MSGTVKKFDDINNVINVDIAIGQCKTKKMFLSFNRYNL